MKQAANPFPFQNSGRFWFCTSSIKANAPAQSGVYAIYNKEQWIYVGDADNIRQRLREHLAESGTPIKKCVPTSFLFEILPAADRVARRDYLIQALRPKFN